MYTDDELLALLPSKQKDFLTKSIGRHLLEVERFFSIDLPSFLEGGHFNEADYFSYNSGAVQLHFADNLTYGLDIYGEELSIVILPGHLSSDGFMRPYCLSATAAASRSLKDCLGRVCQDVRIWTLQEDFESEEAKEVALSYVLSDERELFYCIYLVDDCDSGYLLSGQDISRERVASCFSIARGAYIDSKNNTSQNPSYYSYI
ncbi:hypothetical protein IC235_21105 [Hymenobacter sp. BT664]|uniref:Uncharacterized protein n=1 Tax=Hymenobacter montanus TaxID=2771359 RepID=A0A927BGD6_9BACT|nr:hypothetical protein [Hymenobacter montanus]MBD2770392.1 hypothetical protein [Hymenobacter montanus]